MSKESTRQSKLAFSSNGLLLIFLGVLALVFLPASNPLSLTLRSLFGVACLTAGIALFFQKRWAHLLATITFLVLMAWIVFRLTQANSKWFLILWLLICMYSTYEEWTSYRNHPDASKKSDSDEQAHDMVSMVVWLKEPRSLSAYTLSKYLSKAWNMEFTPLDTNAPESKDESNDNPIGPFVGGSDPTYIASDGSNFFLIHNMAMPYLSDQEKVAKECTDMRMASAILEHQAWIAIDITKCSDESRTMESFYPQLSRFISECHHSSCLALYVPQRQKAYPWLDEVREALLDPNPLAALDKVYTQPILPIDHDDADMQAAIATAKQRWPEFMQAFHNRGANDMFAIKFPLTDEGHTEFIWLNVEDIRDNLIIGTLGNEPAQLPKYQIGDRIEIPTSEVIDWIVGHDDDYLGGFTTKVLMAKSKSKK